MGKAWVIVREKCGQDGSFGVGGGASMELQPRTHSVCLKKKKKKKTSEQTNIAEKTDKQKRIRLKTTHNPLLMR